VECPVSTYGTIIFTACRVPRRRDRQQSIYERRLVVIVRNRKWMFDSKTGAGLEGHAQRWRKKLFTAGRLETNPRETSWRTAARSPRRGRSRPAPCLPLSTRSARESVEDLVDSNRARI
jgi:hypothetical protein